MSSNNSVEDEQQSQSPEPEESQEKSRKRRLEQGGGDPEISSKRVRLDPAPTVQPSSTPQTNTTPPSNVIPNGNESPYQSEATVSTTRASQSHVVTNTAVMGPNGDAVHIRLLLDARQVGGLIGRGGASISQIRQACYARIHIDQQIPGATTRLATVNGSCEQVIRACQLIVDKIAEESSRIPPHNLTILVEEKQCGCVIGRAGREIAEARADTQANIHIPVGTLPRSTEKTIEISGPKDAVFKAIAFVISQLAKNPHHSEVTQPYDPATEAPQAAQAAAARRAHGRGGGYGGLQDVAGGYGLYQTVDGGYVTYGYPQQAYYIQPEAFAQWPQASAAAAAQAQLWYQAPPAHERGSRYPYQ